MAVKVLVVDDSMTVRKAVEKMLAHRAFDVVTVDSAAAARKSIVQKMPAFIITDIIMPIEDGFSLCQSLRKHRRTKHIPVIMMSGVIDEDTKRRAKAVGAVGLLKKPFSQAKLESIVNKVIAYLRKRQQAARKQRAAQARPPAPTTTAPAETAAPINFDLSRATRARIQETLQHIASSANAKNMWFYSQGVVQVQVGQQSVDPQNLVTALYVLWETGRSLRDDLRLGPLEVMSLEYQGHTLLLSVVVEQAGEMMLVVTLLDDDGALSMARYLLRKTTPELCAILRG